MLDLGNVFGNVKPVVIKGVKFEDLNGNGVRDPGEPPMAGIPIQLTGKDGLGRPVNLVTITDANGVFIFPDLLPGTYVANENLSPAGCTTYITNTGTCAPPQVDP